MRAVLAAIGVMILVVAVAVIMSSSGPRHQGFGDRVPLPSSAVQQ